MAEELKDYYEILGLKFEASQAEIEKAFRRMVKNFHPDRYKRDGEEAYRKAVEKFTLINEAYSVLSDPEKRKKYDEILKSGNYIPPQIKARKIQAKNAFKMGMDAFNKGEYSKASMYFKSALSLDPSFNEARAYLAISYVRSGRKREEVLEVLKRFDLIIDKINDPEMFYLIARAYLATGEKNKAKYVIEEGLKLFKNHEKLKELYRKVGGSIFKFFSFK